MTVVTIPVAVFVMATSALATAAPDGSVTVPVIVAPVPWAYKREEPHRLIATTAHRSSARILCELKRSSMVSPSLDAELPQSFSCRTPDRFGSKLHPLLQGSYER